MKKRKEICALSLAALLAAVNVVPAWAVSPEFARTAEEWAKLRDNVMEYEELAGLINEYNVTVQNNQIDYNEFRQDYGVTKEDVSRKYRNLANEILDNLSYPDDDDISYAMTMSTILANETRADDLRKQADDNVEDAMVMWLNYKFAEDVLVTVAQTNMVTYHQKQLELQVMQKNCELLSAQYDAMVAKKGVGMATQLDVLNAQESLLKAQKNVSELETEIKTVKQKLCTMLGWQYNAEPEIKGIPNADLTWIDQIDLQGDQEKALENNYTLKVNQRKLENAQNSNTKESLENSIKDNREKIGSSVTSAYQALLTSRIAYERAQAEAAVESQNMTIADQKYQLGQISRLEHQQQQYSYTDKHTGQLLAELNLVQAMENYQWAVNGLASAQ